MTEHRYTNRLIKETSPYLLQHAHNPVDWYPWGEAAFAKARAENKPVFLSIGYSACHWCHVMERESFENDSIAAIMNEHFVSIKVDREERPDLDDIYMTFVQMTTGSGGWPMSVWLTPEAKPFFGGTYFPPDDAYGRRGFPGVLLAVAEAWQDDYEKILSGADKVVGNLRSMMEIESSRTPLTTEIIDTATAQMLQRFDPIEGGFGPAPKFPPSYSLAVLMRHYARTKDERVLKAVTFTLDKMAAGGIYDQLGGGFHRYSVDAYWLVPHFEKMLYDNALLCVTYLDAYQMTENTNYLRIATEILDYVLRDMSDPAGGFHSAEDADSEGEEGKFYVWTPEEVIAVLGTVDGKLFCDYFGVTNAGNFEHHNSILHIRVSAADFAPRYNYSESSLRAKLAELRAKLLEVRNRRERPFKDDKVLSDWNGLMLSALSRGYQITSAARYLESANRCADFLERTMHTPAGLMRAYRGGQTKQLGFLTDYAFVINGLIDLYEAGFEARHLHFAQSLADEMIARFGDSAGGFFTASADQTDLLVRQKDSYDGAIPSGNSVAAIALVRLAALTDQKRYRETAVATIQRLAGNAAKMPLAYMNLLNALDFTTASPVEIALVGRTDDPGLKALLEEIQAGYIPNRVLAFADPSDPDYADLVNFVPILKGRPAVDGRATAFVCRNQVCKLPATTPAILGRQLREP